MKWAKKQDWRLENLLMDLGGKELNHFNATFFNMIEKALYLMKLEVPAKAILDLKASMCS